MKNSPDTDRSKKVAKLNDLKEQLEERRQEMAAGDELKKQLDNMKNMTGGPADKAAQAMKEGNWEKAKDEVQKLKDQLAKGGLDEKAKQDLAKQIEQMQQKLEAAANAHQQAMQALQKQIEEQKQQGNMAKAGELQQKLDQLQRQQQQMDKLQQMAQQMGAMQQALQQGDNQKAAEAMANLAQQLDQMAKDAQQMKALDQMMNNLEMAKDVMACAECAGAGCEACQGMGMNMGMGKGKNMDGPPGMGMGEGRGKGPRPEEKNDTNFRETRVSPRVGRGSAVLGNMVQGPNIKGDVAEEIRAEMEQFSSQPADPLTIERLPKSRRDHAQEYFNQWIDKK
jgi:tetratricopeptide (TPR) repeat protein